MKLLTLCLCVTFCGFCGLFFFLFHFAPIISVLYNTQHSKMYRKMDYRLWMMSTVLFPWLCHVLPVLSPSNVDCPLWRYRWWWCRRWLCVCMSTPLIPKSKAKSMFNVQYSILDDDFLLFPIHSVSKFKTSGNDSPRPVSPSEFSLFMYTHIYTFIHLFRILYHIFQKWNAYWLCHVDYDYWRLSLSFSFCCPFSGNNSFQSAVCQSFSCRVKSVIHIDETHIIYISILYIQNPESKIHITQSPFNFQSSMYICDFV